MVSSMATSARAQKEAYLRRKGVKGPRPPTLEPTFSLGPDEYATRTDPLRKRERRPSSSFAEKRKAALLSRARGGRPREGDVAMTAVLFAARLKISAAQTKSDEEEQETGSGDTAAQRAPGERTWKQKRKDAYLRTHHTPAPPPPTAAEVTVSTVSFAAKLKTRSLAAPASGDGEEPEHREKSFAQKRKVGLDSR